MDSCGETEFRSAIAEIDTHYTYGEGLSHGGVVARRECVEKWASGLGQDEKQGISAALSDHLDHNPDNVSLESIAELLCAELEQVREYPKDAGVL